MTISRLDTHERSSQAAAFAGIVFLAGQVARDRPHASIAEQMREILDRIDSLLTKSLSDKGRLLNATIWLRTATDYTAMNDAWVAWLPSGAAPARAVIEAAMMQDGWDIEIAVCAAQLER